jgi:hypothetical protein
MTEINAYMNGYQPEGDTEFLAASLEAHKDALKESQQKVERLEKALIQIDAIFNCELSQSRSDSQIEQILKQALETEEKV